MQEKRKALGKGLEQLFINETLSFDDFESKIVDEAKKEDVVEIELDDLRSNPYQPRKIFDEEAINDLAESIKEYGLIQPIIVKKSIKGYEIVAGERRTIAARKAGLNKIKAIVRDFSDEEMMSIALLENIQREDLNIIEEALAYKSMIEILNITQEELARRVKKSRSHITNILGILKLPKKVQDFVLNNKISMGHARCLSKLESDDEILSLANKVMDENLSVRQLEDLVSGSDMPKKVAIKKKIVKDPRYMEVQETMRDKIGSMVKVNKHNIVIPFDSDKDLERVLEILGIDINID